MRATIPPRRGVDLWRNVLNALTKTIGGYARIRSLKCGYRLLALVLNTESAQNMFANNALLLKANPDSLVQWCFWYPRLPLSFWLKFGKPIK